MENEIYASAKTKISPLPGTTGRAESFERTDGKLKEERDEIIRRRKERRRKKREEYQKNRGKK